ncbi:MAG TPA: RDD family protein [Candidatus Rubrimentiphilum sp.]|nr:RDD family protein [Candidatus Rubrimentiphilum sp.]
MDRTLEVRTPESIAFSYELAGLGSRFLAVSVDVTIQTLVMIGILWGLIYAGTHGAAARHVSEPTKIETNLAIAFIAAIIFIVYFGYFILFEAFWNGQTPGKKLMGLRVVRDGGYPADFGSIAIRNLIRVGEFVAGLYAISAVAALMSPENKRLGDMAAGTIVVRDARAAKLADLMEEPAETAHPLMLSPQERALIDQFVARREGMAPNNRAIMASQIGARVRPRVSRDLQQLDDEELLTRLSAL